MMTESKPLKFLSDKPPPPLPKKIKGSSLHIECPKSNLFQNCFNLKYKACK